MRKVICLCAAGALLAGCALFSSDQPHLAGTWADRDMQFTANSSNALLVLRCSRTQFDGEVPLTSGDSFSVAGVVTVAGFAPQIGQPQRAAGKVIGDTLRLWLLYQDTGSGQWVDPPSPDVLVAGQQADFHDSVCLD